MDRSDAFTTALCDRAHAWLPDAPTAWTFNRSDGRHVAQLPDARRDRWCCTHADHNAESDTMQGSTGQTDTERTRKDKQSSLLSTRQAARQAAGHATAVPRPCHCHPRKPCQICQQPSCQSEPNPHGQWLGQGLATSWTDLMLSPRPCAIGHMPGFRMPQPHGLSTAAMAGM